MLSGEIKIKVIPKVLGIYAGQPLTLFNSFQDLVHIQKPTATPGTDIPGLSREGQINAATTVNNTVEFNSSGDMIFTDNGAEGIVLKVQGINYPYFSLLEWLKVHSIRITQIKLQGSFAQLSEKWTFARSFPGGKKEAKDIDFAQFINPAQVRGDTLIAKINEVVNGNTSATFQIQPLADLDLIITFNQLT